MNRIKLLRLCVKLINQHLKVPKRFMIEMVHRVVVLTNLLPCKGGLHSAKIRIGQYVQGLVGGTNDTEQERSIDALYLSRTDNGSAHIVFKLDTNAVVLVNRVVVIPTQGTIINQVN